ncbi:glycosyl transferase family protein [Sphingomonas gilva]|uniref:glycosyl transferase family protein n=1 Tax=Sphingomonas gilva TaxID=2305907 RepID=UPI001FEA5A60|nr:glycosyl transferase family protein [Sphingomonas gilva]
MEGAIWLAEAAASEALLFAAVLFLIGGIDDLAVDVFWIVRHLTRRATVYRRHARKALSDFPPADLHFAMFVPAWDEGAVIAQMLSTTLSRLTCGRLVVFVGCYPNDVATCDAVADVADKDARIVLALNPRQGPTTKADNLNAMWRALQRHEAATGMRFDAVVLHDAEDVVSSGELRVFAHLLERAEVVQLPVLPLVDDRSRWISGHYVDEFAEAHSKMMVVREALGAALPLAGTGFAIDRALLGRLAAARGGAPFDAESLTEDYELGLALSRHGARAMLAHVPVTPGGMPVAVRAHFPASLDEAVRQKARWMTGIALAGWDRVGWSGWRRRPLIENWMRLRDRRAPIAVLALLAAYGGALLWAVAELLGWIGGETVALSVPWWLLAANGALMAWRLTLRAGIVARFYGWAEGVRSIPRALIANVIAMCAARDAMARYVRMLRGDELVWDKTSHVYPGTLPAE